jgi:hypothetical protein
MLEVVDADEDNFIIIGVNALDGPFHEKFPFDRHRINKAFNGLGEVRYGVGNHDPKGMPMAGTFARIRFRPKATGVADLAFSTAEGAFPTRVTYLGEDILGDLDDREDGMQGCQVRISQ